MSARRTRQAQLNAGTANAETANADTSNADTANTGTSNADTANTGTSNAGTANAGPADKALAWPADPNAVTPEGIDFEALAHVLANTCLWGGRSRQFHSLAARAVIVSEEIEALDGLADGDRRALALHALLADARAAWLGDAEAGGPASARAAERAKREGGTVDRAVLAAAGLDPELPGEWAELLRFVRRMTGAAERRDLPDAAIHAVSHGGAGTAFPPLKRRMRPVGPGRAARQWLERFQALKGPPRDALHSGSLNETCGQSNAQTNQQKHDQEKKDVTHLQTKEQGKTEPAQRGVEAEHEKEQEGERSAA